LTSKTRLSNQFVQLSNTWKRSMDVLSFTNLPLYHYYQAPSLNSGS